MPGVTVKDVDAQEFVVAFAKYLKRSGKVALPKYVDFAKTGHYKEMPPQDADWFYVRCAAVARRIYMQGGVGVGWLARSMGTAASNGRTPRHHVKAARGNIRHAIQALEKIKVLEKSKDGGRRITATGRRDLDRIATRLAGQRKAARNYIKNK